MHPSFAPRPAKLARGRGFTLIELLVVITIIALLAGLLLPVIGAVTEKAKKTEAKATESQIIAAVKSYQTEYGQYPVDPQSPAVDATFDVNGPSLSTGLYGHNYILMNVLRASNSTVATGSPTTTYKALNSKQVVYFDSKDVKNIASARSGFIPTAATMTAAASNKGNIVFSAGDLIDPWGNLYYVRIDSDYSTMVYNPYPASDTGTAINYGNGNSDGGTVDPNTKTTVLRTDVISWSPGKDGYMGQYPNGTGTAAAITYGDDVVSWQ